MYNSESEKGDKMKNILLCCNAMGIGGVETVILNQVLAFTSKKYNVYVVAERGEYSNKVEELGGKFIEIDFPEENSIDVVRVNKMVNIIKQNNITEIHIHKYQCIPTILTAALITNTPYFAYEHGIKDTKKYYTWNYPIYKSLFQIYFENAYKIIAITSKVSEITKREYGFDEKKYKIIHNGIDFNEYNNDNPNYNNSLENIFIISRIDKEKLPTIFNGIDAFIQLLSIEKNAKLNIIGGGNAEEEVIKYLEEKGIKTKSDEEKAIVKFLGRKTDVTKYLKEADLILGVGRCVLEAIAMMVPTVVTGYKGINGLITIDNMSVAMQENFSGINMESITNEKFVESLLELKQNKKKILNDVYNIAKKNLDCYKNYINIPENQNISFEWIKLFELLKTKEITIEEQSKDIKLKYEWIKKIEKDNEDLLKKNKKITEENVRITEENKVLKENNIEYIKKEVYLKEEIHNIYNSKRWKLFEKIDNIIYKKGKEKKSD